MMDYERELVKVIDNHIKDRPILKSFDLCTYLYFFLKVDLTKFKPRSKILYFTYIFFDNRNCFLTFNNSIINE
jgi:hypothetical protein